MGSTNLPSSDRSDSLDSLVADLVTLKDAGGSVSYAELVRRIADLRIARGMSPAAAQPSRTTVYDAFRPGRARINPDLLRDIVLALGRTDDEATEWVARYRALRASSEPAPRRAEPIATPKPAAAAPPPLAAPKSAALMMTALQKAPASLSRRFVALLMLGGVLVNFAGMATVQALHLPIYLDMAGTAATAIILGPWHGVAVGLTTNVFGFVIGSPGAAPYALVNVAGALVWGYGVRRFGLGASLHSYFTLNLLVAVACSLVGTPLNVLMFGGFSGHGSDGVVSSIVTMGLPVLAAAFSANILTSVLDKLLAGFIALTVFAMLHSRFGVPAAHMPLVERLSSPMVPAPTSRLS
ncbi:ECF transporter S component [Microbacterium radiodurans]|uniref:ECF transporter S component n=1 Tax=Microbacterium radiodurans TaxID=661398 RepID=A0A5J5IN51_9MICO|nr:ECF transporter S component [Microbacterium radiodurans]KAA9084139.1 hypothetical protein F6B42_14260 [Microbacterium radiodurans]